MRVPPLPIAEVLQAAARATGVPYTLLAAIAHQESGYDPTAVGPKTKGGWSALGLMQLSPATAKTYGLPEVDVFDPARNALVGAKYLAALMQGTNGEWERTIAAYHMGLAGLKAAEKKGALPDATRLYVSTVIGNRRWLQAQHAAVGGTAIERLARAIYALSEANPISTEASDLWKSFKSWYTSTPGKSIADNAVLNFPALETSWREYARIYDRAAITGHGTPPPYAIEPKLWQELVRRAPVPQGYQQAFDFGDHAASVIDALEKSSKSSTSSARSSTGSSSAVGFLLLAALLALATRR